MSAKNWPKVLARNPVSSDKCNLVQNLNGSFTLINSVIISYALSPILNVKTGLLLLDPSRSSPP